MNLCTNCVVATTVYRDTQALTERNVTARWAGQVHSTNGAMVSSAFGLKSVVIVKKYAGSLQQARGGGMTFSNYVKLRCSRDIVIGVQEQQP